MHECKKKKNLNRLKGHPSFRKSKNPATHENTVSSVGKKINFDEIKIIFEKKTVLNTRGHVRDSAQGAK